MFVHTIQFLSQGFIVCCSAGEAEGSDPKPERCGSSSLSVHATKDGQSLSSFLVIVKHSDLI